MLTLYLEAAGYRTFIESSIDAALHSRIDDLPSVYVLDLDVLEEGAWRRFDSVCRREAGNKHPVLIAFAHHFSKHQDRANALATGIDHYFVDPTCAEVLTAIAETQ